MNIWSDSIFTWAFFHKLEKRSALLGDDMVNHEMKLQKTTKLTQKTRKQEL